MHPEPHNTGLGKDRNAYLGKEAACRSHSGADLNSKVSWAIVLQDQGQNVIGYDHAKQSAILLNEDARVRIGLPLLTELANRTLNIRLKEIELQQEKGEEDWIKPLWKVWREDSENCSKVFLSGLERHEYVEYDEHTDYGEGGPLKYSRLPDEAKAVQLKFSTVAKKKAVLIASFSSSVPSGYSGPPMGEEDQPRYPSYHLALSVTQEEYSELSALLERPVAFELEFQVL